MLKGIIKKITGTMLVAALGIGSLASATQITFAASYSGVAYSADYSTWKQGNAPWGSKKLGDLCTMSDSGCLVTSIAILMAKSGVENPNTFCPGTLRDRYESKGFISHNKNSKAADGNLSYSAYSQSNSPNFYSVETSNFHPTPFKDIYTKISNMTSRGYYTVVNVCYGGHFVAVNYCSNGEIYIHDPAGNGKTKLSQYDGGIEGATYFVAKKSGPVAAMSTSGVNTPGNIKVGNVFSLYGTISSGSVLKSVTVGVYNSLGTMMTGKSANPNAYSYNIHNLDNYVLFNKLAAGTYSYKVIATDASGTKTLVNKSFKVIGANNNPVVVKPTATYITSLTGAKKAFKLRWKKQGNVSGYQTAYSVNKSFKGGKIYTSKKANYIGLNVSGLKSKKTYYVKVRTYRTANGKTTYSAWSAVKSVKTK